MLPLPLLLIPVMQASIIGYFGYAIYNESEYQKEKKKLLQATYKSITGETHPDLLKEQKEQVKKTITEYENGSYINQVYNYLFGPSETKIAEEADKMLAKILTKKWEK